ncbi:uncharacterized protein LOC127242028 [Andrographis paniculata]|uniref:uncharacterized protein LOC127242028 n=1 Tax=Andrographis paniculata TaxID=175694 RepID=UPI0021E83F0A|nr:uncharacterized protein LOC127242028 [Andrographis paniculata]
MEIIPFARKWRRSRAYSRLSPTNRRNLKVARLGTADADRQKRRPSWRLRLSRKLRLKSVAPPARLWNRFRNAYMKMMMRLAEVSGTSNGGDVFGDRRSGSRSGMTYNYSRAEFENRLVLEICKSMAASLELGYHK